MEYDRFAQLKHGSSLETSILVGPHFKSSSVSESNDKQRIKRRSVTAGWPHIRPILQRNTSDICTAHAASKVNEDPLCVLLGMEADTDCVDSSLRSPTLHSRGRRSKRYIRSAPSSFGARNYSTALGPLEEKHKLNPLERVFLEAAERGDKSTLARCLNFKEKVNVNCVNMLGRTAIQIAVDNENIELVELLLQQDGIKIGDALLYAIQEGVYRIVEMLIDHPSITKEMLGSCWKDTEYGFPMKEEESHDFSADISPVILAAVCNQFEILQLLLDRGARIEEPHKSSCGCVQCCHLVAEDPLKHTLQRINTYRALASPAWISLTSPDPILTAFELSSELLHLASRENEFKETFISLSEQCRKYACDLLDLCRGTGEVVAVLSKSNTTDTDEFSESDDEPEVLNKAISHSPSDLRPGSLDSGDGSKVAHSESYYGSTTRPDRSDWRRLAHRSNGSKRRQASGNRANNGAQLYQGHSLESQRTVSDELIDDMSTPGASRLYRKQCISDMNEHAVQCHNSTSLLNVPGPLVASSVQTHEDTEDKDEDSLRRLEIMVPTPANKNTNPSVPLTHKADSTSDEGLVISFATNQPGQSNLFSGQRKVSFDHESTQPPAPNVDNGSVFSHKIRCFQCKLRKTNKQTGAKRSGQCMGIMENSFSKDEQGFCAFKLDRLKLAIKHEQKKVSFSLLFCG
ncbi:hypothetical protein P879_00322 [Paragonimus westermani]|uniref:Transient receptor ion channel domain-containing protein n=1 Tax=Paragonimus westermani TaxID=34504 RepID=A0A8T0DX88_9TREM|nr:hypothetical protein P879_00322 [Paragonimus westermani]